VEEVEEYQHPRQEEAEVEVEEVPPEDHPLPTEDSKEIPLSNSQETGKEAKHSC